eukprot:2406065-Rhodomonas_salina.1
MEKESQPENVDQDFNKDGGKKIGRFDRAGHGVLVTWRARVSGVMAKGAYALVSLAEGNKAKMKDLLDRDGPGPAPRASPYLSHRC